MPPMTPPTMPPIGVELLGAVCPGKEPIRTQVVVAHESHDAAFKEHVSSAEQAGHEGGSGGHCTHRRNRG